MFSPDEIKALLKDAAARGEFIQAVEEVVSALAKLKQAVAEAEAIKPPAAAPGHPA